jgi:TolB-like protein
MSFWTELRRRNVFKVGVAYAIVAWLVLQVAAIAFPALHLPAWTVTFVTALLLLGIPVALLLAWAYEVTPEGIKRTREVPHGQSITHLTGQKLNYIVTALLVVAVAFIAVDNYVLSKRVSLEEARPASAEAPQAAAASPAPAQSRAPSVLPNSVAVLPFENLSPNKDDAYFAEGIHEEILNYLAKLKSLNVISRTSVVRYANTDKPIQEIAKELNVETVMEGSVRYANDRVRVTTQLIDALVVRSL